MKICVIGFGAAGLAAARHASVNHDCVVFEQYESLGGTWVYTEDTGTNRFGLPIHTSMYRSLRTNLPKEIMGYPDFPIPEQEQSYIPAKEILNFLQLYANRFDLMKLVKFNHYVQNVEPVDNLWRVSVKDLLNDEEKEFMFDAVMVCNGHYHTPMYPTIPGMETFTGEQFHSHDYRHPEIFTGKNVIVIGAGPSGLDLSLEIATKAKKVYLSRHRGSDEPKNVFPSNVEMRFEVSEIRGNKLTFDDGKEIEVDVIFYCTGYKYSFPFLSNKCGVVVEDNCVQPLYKHLIHIDHPTLCLIGLPYYVCAFSLFDLQVRYFLKHLDRGFKLPSKEEMIHDTEKEMEERKKQGLKRKQFHMMGTMQGDYYADLAKSGGLDPLPPVMADLHNFASQKQLDDLINFRENVYKILDPQNFIQVK
ncbi:flavin-containing monooxygenase FMO GS-OX5-like [Cimex lectularius]|uniref:Flavin-containing monooxygenase n=1 Tax=Cimex lectularius TaxID=79782 RepID=A0A8I6REA6_CIMLE|nr:flavin-containing monooxygenase FMO GS-OX5-like [Cimex lectularius]